jgi:hypothetical protein
MMSGSGADLTVLFARMRHGDAEAANAVMGEKLPTVRRDWVFARSWLKTRFQPVARG